MGGQQWENATKKLVLTGDDTEEVQREGKQAGADYIRKKPLKIADLEKIIKEISKGTRRISEENI